MIITPCFNVLAYSVLRTLGGLYSIDYPTAVFIGYSSARVVEAASHDLSHGGTIVL